MAQWKGINTGNVEFLWDEDVLRGTLGIFRRLQPFSRHSPSDPVYRELQLFRKSAQWSNGSPTDFRNIFRKGDLWSELGLTREGASPDTWEVTPLGEQFLDGVESYSRVALEAAARHIENGERPYALICAAFLENPHLELSAEDIEFGIFDHFEPGVVRVQDALLLGGKGDNKLRPQRKRLIRTSLMTLLEKAGAVVATDYGWRVADIDAVERIAIAAAYEGSSPISPQPRTPEVARRRAKSGIRPVPTVSRYLRRFEVGLPRNHADTVEAMERATKAHDDLVIEVAGIARSLNSSPYESVRFDLLIRADATFLFEMKTIVSVNAKNQLRKGVAQLAEYRFLEALPVDTRKVLVLDNDPRPWLSDGFLDFVEQDQHIRVFWKSSNGFTSRSGASLTDYLAVEFS